MDEKIVLNFFFELAQLRRIKHEGLRLAGVENPDSVAEHSLRSAQIGYVLACLEKYGNSLEVAGLLIFHDIGECRIGDLHKVAHRYVQADEGRAVEEQLAPLGEVGQAIHALWKQTEHRNTQAGIIAKDADWLEMALTAKEYVERGYVAAEDWIKNVTAAVQTESAKKLLAHVSEVSSTDWWCGLKKL